MAIREVRLSDISDEPNASTVVFGVGDKWYEIDLTKKEVEELEQSVARFVERARPTKPDLRARPKVPNLTKAQRQDIRNWAQENGYEIAPYGRLPLSVVEAYAKEKGITFRMVTRD